MLKPKDVKMSQSGADLRRLCAKSYYIECHTIEGLFPVFHSFFTNFPVFNSC